MELALESPTSRLVLDNRRVDIGRLPTNQFVLDDPQVSGLHAEIIPTACGCLLIDLGGRNRTFVNGHRLIPDVPYTLRSGDKIRVGQTALRFWVRVTPMQHLRIDNYQEPMVQSVGPGKQRRAPSRHGAKHHAK